MSEPAPDYAALIARLRQALDMFVGAFEGTRPALAGDRAVFVQTAIADAIAALRGATPADDPLTGLPPDGPKCRRHSIYKLAVAHYYCEECAKEGRATVGPANAEAPPEATEYHEPVPDHAALMARLEKAIEGHEYAGNPQAHLLRDAIAALRGATPAGWQDFTRLTVVDESGCVYERWNVVLEPSVQDQGRTFKVFVTPHHANLSAPPEATE